MLSNETRCGWRIGTKCKFFYRRICLACVSTHQLDQRLYSSGDCGRAETRLNYHLVQQELPIFIPASERVKTCILQHCQKVYPRDDDRLRKSCSTDGRFRNKCNASSSQDCEVHLITENVTAVLRTTKQLTAHGLQD